MYRISRTRRSRKYIHANFRFFSAPLSLLPPPHGKEGPVFTSPSQSVLFHWGSFIDHTAAGFTGFGIIVFPGAVGIRAGPASVRVNIGHGSVCSFDDFRPVNQVVVVEVSILDIRPGIGGDVIGAVNIDLIDRA